MLNLFFFFFFDPVTKLELLHVFSSKRSSFFTAWLAYKHYKMQVFNTVTALTHRSLFLSLFFIFLFFSEVMEDALL